mmetsp:Transcript_71549/g.83238  ORF Transcript_71549/g.83238 Transcript_71549/m.83238 type:complete len:202 (+) Transcript_71549:594-1199(+)
MLISFFNMLNLANNVHFFVIILKTKATFENLVLVDSLDLFSVFIVSKTVTFSLNNLFDSFGTNELRNILYDVLEKLFVGFESLLLGMQRLDFVLQVLHFAFNETDLSKESLVEHLVLHVLLYNIVNIDLNVLLNTSEFRLECRHHWNVISSFSVDISKQINSAFLEHFMSISMVIVVVFLLFEVVHVQLSDKRGKVIVFEV